MPAPRSLLIDIGNSEMLLAVYAGDAQESLLRVPAQAGWEEWVGSFVQDHLDTAPLTAMAASVSPLLTSKLQELFKTLDAPLHFLTAEECSLQLLVDTPGEVGTDRIANGYGGLKLYPGENLIIVDLGTALVFDVIRHDRAFLGGSIAPGIGLSAHALHTETSLLPEVVIERPAAAIATSTEGNICSGVYHGILGTIERTLCLMRNELETLDTGHPIRTVAVGGVLGELGHSPNQKSELISTQLREDLEPLIDVIEPELTILGLKEALAERHARHKVDQW